MVVSGGAARCKTAFNWYRASEKLVAFSGDLISPSLMSSYFEGEQMLMSFNELAPDVSMIGNHELDFGPERGEELLKQTNSPWLCTNLRSIKENRPLLGCLEYYIKECQGFKIGFLGLCEEEWLGLLNPKNDRDDIQYLDYNQTLKKYSKFLKEEKGCDLVITLTHMRMPRDEDLAEKNDTSVVDLVLGGHDHFYGMFLNKQTGIFTSKSGTDFEHFTNLTVLFGVSQAEYLKFVTVFGAKLKFANMVPLQKNNDYRVEYSAST